MAAAAFDEAGKQAAQARGAAGDGGFERAAAGFVSVAAEIAHFRETHHVELAHGKDLMPGHHHESAAEGQQPKGLKQLWRAAEHEIAVGMGCGQARSLSAELLAAAAFDDAAKERAARERMKLALADAQASQFAELHLNETPGRKRRGKSPPNALDGPRGSPYVRSCSGAASRAAIRAARALDNSRRREATRMARAAVAPGPPPPGSWAGGSCGRNTVYLSCGGVGAAPAAEEYLPVLVPELYEYRLQHGGEEETRQPEWDGTCAVGARRPECAAAAEE